MNPESGKAKKLSGYKEFYDILRKYSYETEIMFTERKNHASEIIENLPNDIDLVISAGGDGTLNEVVTGNMRRDKKLVIANLPMGSTNDVANMYGYTKNMVSMQGLGYKEIIDYLQHETTLEEAVEILKRDTRHFAKRQLTWFRRERDVIWLNKDLYDSDEAILEDIRRILLERQIIDMP